MVNKHVTVVCFCSLRIPNVGPLPNGLMAYKWVFLTTYKSRDLILQVWILPYMAIHGFLIGVTNYWI